MVAPLVGAWIEILEATSPTSPIQVAPLVGAWIEIADQHQGDLSALRRSPRGSVD